MSTPLTGAAIRGVLEKSRLTLQALEPLANARGADAEWRQLNVRLSLMKRRSFGNERDLHLRTALQELVEDAEHLIDRVIG